MKLQRNIGKEEENTVAPKTAGRETGIQSSLGQQRCTSSGFAYLVRR